MKQVNMRKEAIIWLILLLPFIYSLIVWNKIPEQVPTHFNVKGEPDDYSGKAFALLMLPFMNVIIYFILFLLLTPFAWFIGYRASYKKYFD